MAFLKSKFLSNTSYIIPKIAFISYLYSQIKIEKKKLISQIQNCFPIYNYISTIDVRDFVNCILLLQ